MGPVTDASSPLIRSVRGLCRLIDALTFAGGVFAAACCAVLALMLITEIVATSAFSWSQPWAVEYFAYLCGFTMLAGSGYGLRSGSHIRVMLALEWSPGRVKLAIELFCTVAALVVASMLAWGLAELAWRSHVRNSVSYFAMQTPLAWPQALMATGAVLLACALLARLLRLLIGDPPDLSTDAGSATARAE